MQGLAEGDEQLEVPDAALGCRRPLGGQPWAGLAAVPGSGAVTESHDPATRTASPFAEEVEIGKGSFSLPSGG